MSLPFANAKLKLLRLASLPISPTTSPQDTNQPLTRNHKSATTNRINTNNTSLSISSKSASSRSTLSSPASPVPPPTHHDPTGNGFRNPWPSAVNQPSNSLLNSIFTNGIPLELARKPNPNSSLRPTSCVPAQLDLYDGFLPQDWKTRRSTKLIATWLGHAGCLVQLPCASPRAHSPRPFRLLFDPIFSARAGPSAFTGPKRLIGPPCRIADLPQVDVCCISHSHYDHLDYETVKELIKQQPHLVFYVPLGLKVWFATTPVPSEQVVEMDWWDSQSFPPASVISSASSSGSYCDAISTTPSTISNVMGKKKIREDSMERPVDDEMVVRINCVPAQHSSGRSLLDQNASLWCGWVVEQIRKETRVSADPHDRTTSPDNIASKRASVYFAGDTGYRNGQDSNVSCPAFREIGEKYGPIDFSMIPIWRGGSLSFISWAGLRLADENLLSVHHATPADAVRIHQDVRSRHSIAVHHGCFVGSTQESFEALEELEEARLELGVGDWMEEGGFGAVDVGVTVELDPDHSQAS